MKNISTFFSYFLILVCALVLHLRVSSDLFSIKEIVDISIPEIFAETNPYYQTSPQEEAIIPNEQTMKAHISTNKGDFELELFHELAPKTVENFVKLAQEGFYNGVKFHRVIAGFMIQGGDPLTKDDTQEDFWGTGGPGYTFADEIHPENHNVIGTISMANAGPNTNGSQFFINTADNNFLDTKHTVFGKVISGMDTIKAIEAVATFPNDRPVETVTISSIEITQ
ncbi:MAG: peptidylprolyl isomerase [Candidatus Pacebacteria bacterium]|nr:peptidylprolyl isomerase [Candidatus Paceibacterota bacterium]